MLRIVASYSCCVPSERVARYASTFGAVSWSDAALKRSSTASAFNVSVAAEAICVSSLVVRATRTSSKSFCGSGKSPRAAAKRAGCGALPLMMAWTTGFVDVISADKAGTIFIHRLRRFYVHLCNLWMTRPVKR